MIEVSGLRVGYGEHIVFVRVLPPHNFEIFLMHLETREQRQLTFHKAFDGFPVLSPDGKTLCFSSSRDRPKGDRGLCIFLMDVSSLDLGA